VVSRSASPKKPVQQNSGLKPAAHRTPTRKENCMSPTPVTRDADSASYLEDTPNKEMMAALNRPIPSKFDCSKRVTRGQGSNSKDKT
jgi:hypothetical protein